LRRAVASLTVALASTVALSSAVISVGRGQQWWPHAVVGGVFGAVLGAALVSLLTFRKLASGAVGAVIGAGTATAVVIVGRDDHRWDAFWFVIIALAVFLAAWAVEFLVLSRRGVAVANALVPQLRREGGPRPLLRDIVSPVHHVICATDLESGTHFFMSQHILYGYRQGLADTKQSDLELVRAIQASATVPGALPPVNLPMPRFQRDASVTVPPVPPDRVVLVDGGVYDNMGEEWEFGWDSRVALYPQLAQVQQASDLLVVANASPRWLWKPFTARGLILREILSVAKSNSIEHAITTSRRRFDLLRQFNAEESSSSRGGVLVMLDICPLDTCRAFLSDPGDRGRRAAEAVAFLQSYSSDADWDRVRDANSKVHTTLAPLTPEATLRLLEHSFTSTMVGLYVVHGIGALQRFDPAPFVPHLG
jgi:hypothetical protein